MSQDVVQYNICHFVKFGKRLLNFQSATKTNKYNQWNRSILLLRTLANKRLLLKVLLKIVSIELAGRLFRQLIRAAATGGAQRALAIEAAVDGAIEHLFSLLRQAILVLVEKEEIQVQRQQC